MNTTWDFQQCGMCDQQRLRPACAYAQTDQSICKSLEYAMILRLLTNHNLEFLSLKVGCTGSSESTLVKIPHCWKSYVTAQMNITRHCYNHRQTFRAKKMEKLVNMQITITSKSTKSASSFPARLIPRFGHTDTHARTQWKPKNNNTQLKQTQQKQIGNNRTTALEITADVARWRVALNILYWP